MSGTTINIRTTEAFKANTRELIERLVDFDLRDSRSLSEYATEAIREKRERDSAELRKCAHNTAEAR